MLKYNQPNFYKFNEDSIKLVKFVDSTLADQVINKVIDVGCGSGVLGIEYSIKNNSKIDFLEKQKDFIPFLEKNIETFSINDSRIIHSDFLEHIFDQKYDLILVNPPYFCAQRARKSSNEQKNICRLIDERKIIQFCTKLKEILSCHGYLGICYPESNLEWTKSLNTLNLSLVNSKTENKIFYLVFKNV